MKAIKIHQYGGPEVLKFEEATIEQPKPGQVIVNLKASGVNFVDIYQREGTYQVGGGLPYTPGREGAGIVEAIGDGVTNVKPGDRVAYVDQLGAYSEKSIVNADRLILLPKEFSFELGAACFLQGMTAHYLLHEFRKIKTNDIVLIHAAAGGMGLILVQLAKSLGAKVIGTVSSEEKAKAVKKARADEVIIYTKNDFVTELKRLTNNHGADLIIDGVGKTTFTKNLDAAALLGTIVIYGAASGPADPITPNALMAKSLTIGGGSLPNFIKTRDALLYRANAVIEAIKQGVLEIQINKTLPLSQAKDAHQLLQDRKTIGKVILYTG